MNVSQLLERSELGLSLVWAEPGMLQRPVSGAYIVDLPSPGHFLAAGNVVLTSALWATGPESAEVFVSALAEKSVAALVVGRIVIGEIPDYVQEACQRWGIALLTVSQTVSFMSIAQFINATVVSGEWPPPTRSANFNRALLDALASGPGTQGALDMFYREFAVGGWVLGSAGSVIAVAGADPSPNWVAAVWNRVIGAAAAVAVVPDDEGRPSSVWPVVAEGGQPVGYLVCSGDHRAWPVELERVMRTLVTVVRIELELENTRRSADMLQFAELVDLLSVDAVSPGEASARLRLLGVDPLTPLTVVTAAVDGAYPVRAILAAVTDMFTDDAHTVFGAELGHEAVVFVSGGDTSPEELIRLADRSAPAQQAMLGSRRIRLGVSERTTSVSQLAAAVATARSRMRSATGAGPFQWATGSTPPSYAALLELLPERVRTSFRAGLLTPLLDYDARHGSELVQTLQVFLERGGAWQQAAGELHVHVNTLRYRIGRIEALTSRDLGNMKDRIDFSLALAIVDG